MKKVIYKHFGDERVLELTEQPMPAFKNNELLIRVKAVSINPLDWKIYGGEMKLLSGSKFPKGVGIDFSGVVENAGSLIGRFKKGDEVIGILDSFKGEALADYIVVQEKNIVIKPGNNSFEEAAALPVTGLSALEIIDQLAAIGPNQEVLINGASGGIGVFAVQIAKQRGAKVTAVAGTQGIAVAKDLGADTVVDYTVQDIFSLDQKFDAFIDLSTKVSFAAAKKLMKKKATFITTLPSPLTLLHSFFNNLFPGKKFKVLNLKPTPHNLDQLTALVKNGLKIRLDKQYSISEVRRAYQEARHGKTIGKSVITLD
ncbi:MAG: NAD(P)-dependent alcohol dehydrogenase [Bacteroidota bacterium]